MKQKGKALHTFFFRNWWTIFVVLLCYGFYLHAMHQKRTLLHALEHKTVRLQAQLRAANAESEDLLMQIQSQSDPAWIELLIKKQLGMVPYGQTKVYFVGQ